MSEEEETADEQDRRRVEDESDKLRDVAEEEKQVDTNREPQDEEEKDEGKNMWIQRYRIANPKMRKRKTKATWKNQRHGILKIHAGRGKHLGWNPKKSM